MLSIQKVAEALMNRQATVAGIASLIGTLGERQSSEYKVTTSFTGIQQVSIGIPAGQDAGAAPKYVHFFFSAEHPVALAHVVPGCTSWKLIPNNAKESPYLYACRFPGSNDSIEVLFSATLTGDIASPSSHLSKLLLQRSVWQ